MARFAALIVAGAVLSTGCGAVTGPSAHPLPTPPYAALAKWNDFPAAASPRPIIAFGDAVEHIQPSGFPDGDRKIAWMCNKFLVAAGVAFTPEAAGALTKLMSKRAATSGAMPECAALAPFVITDARLADAGFPTDRGMQQLPAWLFDVPEVNAYIGLLAVDPSRLWQRRLFTEPGRGAGVSADGMTLRIAAPNQQPGPCGNDYTAVAAESTSAVAIAVRQFPHSAPGANVVCDAMLRIGYVDVRLAAPIGGRVLVDEAGQVGAACAIGTEDC
jgi:hypothetical protein